MAENGSILKRFFLRTPKESSNGEQKVQANNRDYWRQSRGGYVNPGTGAGTASDKMRLATVTPTYITQREYFEICCVELWQMRRLVNVIAQDMTSKWREFETNDSSATVVDTLLEQEKKHEVKDSIETLIQSARQFGTAVLVMVTKEAPLDQPLIVERLRPGDLIDLRVVDRFDLQVYEKDRDLYSKDYGRPLRYRWNSGYAGEQIIHHSRVLRYDAETLPERRGHVASVYDSDWGLSVIISIISEVFRDEDMASSVNSQMLRSGVFVVQSDSLNEMIAGGLEGGKTQSLQSVLQEIESGVRSHKMILVSGENNVSFLSPNFASLDKIISKMEGRLAAAFGIPQTRLWGRSPEGMNATGDSDENNYSDMLKSLQETKLTRLLDVLDLVLAADGGINVAQIPKWSWLPYRAEDRKKIAETSKIKAEALNLVYNMRAITENEIRAVLSGDPTFGELPELSEDELENFFGEEEDEENGDDTGTMEEEDGEDDGDEQDE